MHTDVANNIRSITLTLTEKCNLSCSYCYEHTKTSRSMQFDVAKNILDKELENKTADKLYIELFGGEPFLEFELIKRIHQYITESGYKKQWIIFATTNGTLIHGEVQKWLKEHPCVVAGLSLDGTKKMHDINRSNSYDRIDFDFFLKTYPEQGVKMTISQETLPFLSEGVIHAHTLGFKVNCNLAFGIDWSSQANAKFLERELKKLICYYVERPTVKPCSMLDFPIDQLGCDKSSRRMIKKWCGTGTHMCAYDVDGNAYPCQFFMPLSANKMASQLKQELKFEEDIPLEKLDSKCRECVIVEACPTCYGSNYITYGNIYKKDENLCNLTKIILKARSYFKALQWNNGLLKVDGNAEQALLRSIILIQEEL